MSSERPDYHDADLILRLYDLRRETVMRESRNTLNFHFLPKSYEEFFAVTQPTHPMSAAFRQVSGYWEMAYGFAKHGIVNPDYLADNAFEGFFLFAKVAPFLEQFRAEASPMAFQNTDWLVRNSKVAAQRFELVQKRVAAMKNA